MPDAMPVPGSFLFISKPVETGGKEFLKAAQGLVRSAPKLR